MHPATWLTQDSFRPIFVTLLLKNQFPPFPSSGPLTQKYDDDFFLAKFIHSAVRIGYMVASVIRISYLNS